MKSGSLDLWIWSSVTSASDICLSIASGPPERSVALSEALSGIASLAPTLPGAGPASSGDIGVTCLGLALLASGVASVAPLMSFSAPFLPSLTWPPTASLTPSALKSSASSRFLGAALSIASLTAAMNAARSNVPGFCSDISSTCAAWAWLEASLDGGSAAACADAAPAAAGAWCLEPVAAAFVLPFIAWNLGSACGSLMTGSAAGPATAAAGAPPAAA